MSKNCSRCFEKKPLDAFHKDKHHPSGYRSHCKSCQRKVDLERYHVNPEKERLRGIRYYYSNREKVRNDKLKSKYGITLVQYRDMLAKQGGRCAICGTEKDPCGRDFAVDHCHKTDKIRGLLCLFCNTGLGKFYDSKELLQKAIMYLEKGPNFSEPDLRSILNV